MLAAWLVGAGWQWFCRNKLFVMRPYEAALQELESIPYRASRGMMPDPRRVVLDILQDYIEVQFGLRLPKAGREAALRSLTQTHSPLTPSQQVFLRSALETPGDAPNMNLQQCTELSEKAARFVWATAWNRVPKGTVVSLAGAGGASRPTATGH